MNTDPFSERSDFPPRAVLTEFVIDVQKQLFIWYGADSYDVYANSENRTQQALQIESIYNFITSRVSVRTTFINYRNCRMCKYKPSRGILIRINIFPYQAILLNFTELENVEIISTNLKDGEIL